jgi:hypothetical protein
LPARQVLLALEPHTPALFIFFVFVFCSTGVWTQGLHLEVTSPALFCDGFFRDRVSRTICLGWFRTAILLIPASWVAKITDVSHWHLSVFVIFGIGSHIYAQARLDCCPPI